MKIDLHVHTSERSFCAHASEDAQIQAAIAQGLDAIAITDHDRLAPPARLRMLNAKYRPFRIFGGVEVSLSEHVLVLGVQHPALESGDWTYPALHRFVTQRGGFLALAHPYRFYREIQIDVERYPPHAFEVASHNTPEHAAPKIRALANELGAGLLSNSDAHVTKAIGRYYNHLRDDPADDAALVTALKVGDFALFIKNHRRLTPRWRGGKVQL